MPRRLICLFMLLVSFVFAQNYNELSRTKIDINETIVDFYYENNQPLFLSGEGKIISFSNNSVNKSKVSHNAEYYNRKTNNLISDIINRNEYIYIGATKDEFYACKYDNSFSSHFVVIDSSKNVKFFNYTRGIPSGVFVTDDKLWYVSNRSSLMSKSIISIYDRKSFQNILNIEIPVLDAKGLNVQDDIITTYENCSKSFVKFKITEE